MAHRSSWYRGKGSRRMPSGWGGRLRRPARKVAPAEKLRLFEPPDLLPVHPWIFGIYAGAIRAFVFRDRSRTRFGILVLKDAPGTLQSTLDEWATRVVVDAAFRDSLLTRDQAARKVWLK